MARKSNNTGIAAFFTLVGVGAVASLGPAGFVLLFFIGLVALFVFFIKLLVETEVSSDKPISITENLSITYDDILKDKIKLGEPSVEYLKRGGIKKITIPVYCSELGFNKDISAKSVVELKYKIEDMISKWVEKYKTQIEKKDAKDKKFALQEFNLNTIKFYNIDANKTKISQTEKVTFDLKDEIEIVDKYNPAFFNSDIKLNNQKITNFLMDGRFNSVRGIEGLNTFKNELMPHLDVTQISHSILSDIIFKSGIYYEYENAPEVLRKYDDETKWKAFLRQILIYANVTTLSEVNLEELKSNHYKIFDTFSDLDKTNLELVIKDSSIYLLNDLTEYFAKLNEKIVA